MKKIFYLMIILCLNTQIVLGADAALIPDNIRLEHVLETYAEPDLGIKVGKIDMIQGKAIIIHAESSQAYWIKEEYPLFKGDTIITLKGGRIRLQLNDGSILTLASETRLLINQSVYDSDAKSRSSFMGMAIGKARFVVRKLHDALQSDFKIKTQTAVVGVRGSDFIVEADADSTKVVTLDDTRLEIISLADSKMEQTVLTDYEKIMVGHDALPSAVEAVSIEDAKQMIREMDITPVSPEKLQVNTEKFHHGSQKEIVQAVPEKVKEDVKAAAVEKTELNHAITPEKAKSGQADKVEIKAVESVKTDQSQKTEIRTEIQGINTIGLPKAEVSEKVNLKTDIQGAVKDKVVEFVKAEQIEKVEIMAIESPKLEALDIKVFAISKPDTIQQTDTIRAAVADVVRENKEVIQSNVAEIKVLSAQDVSGSLSLTGTAQGNVVINSSPGKTSFGDSSEKGVSETSQVVIENPISDDKIVTFTLPSQLENPIRQPEITVPAAASGSQLPTTTLPTSTNPTGSSTDTPLPTASDTTKPAAVSSDTPQSSLPNTAQPAAMALSHTVKPTDISSSATPLPTVSDTGAAKPSLPDSTQAAIITSSHTAKPTDSSITTPLPAVSDTSKPTTTSLPDSTKPATETTASATTLPDMTKPAAGTSASGTFLPNIQTQLPAPTMSPTSPLVSPSTIINRH